MGGPPQKQPSSALKMGPDTCQTFPLMPEKYCTGIVNVVL